MLWIGRVGEARPADDLAQVIDGIGAAVGAEGVLDAQGSEQFHFAAVAKAVSIVVVKDIGPPAVVGGPQEGDAADESFFIDAVAVAGIVVVEGGNVRELIAAP